MHAINKEAAKLELEMYKQREAKAALKKLERPAIKDSATEEQFLGVRWEPSGANHSPFCPCLVLSFGEAARLNYASWCHIAAWVVMVLNGAHDYPSLVSYCSLDSF